jgi:hypothetical protein
MSQRKPLCIQFKKIIVAVRYTQVWNKMNKIQDKSNETKIATANLLIE